MPRPKKPIVRLHPFPPIGPRIARKISYRDPPPGVRYRYVRYVRGSKVQARIWCKRTHGHVNLGLYDDIWQAQRVVDKYLQDGIIPEGILPTYVYRRREGYYARYYSPSFRFSLVLPGPYEDAMTAQRAMVRLIQKMRPLRLEEFRIYYGPAIIAEMLKQTGKKKRLPPVSKAIGLSLLVLRELVQIYGFKGLRHQHITTRRRAI